MKKRLIRKKLQKNDLVMKIISDLEAEILSKTSSDNWSIGEKSL